jgi:hypothetical protein
MTEDWTPTESALIAAEGDLEWWHAASASALGARGAGLEPSTTYWDDMAIDRLFEIVLSRSRKDAVGRFYRILRMMRQLDQRTYARAATIYHKRRYPSHLDARFWVEATDSAGHPYQLCLVGAALVTTAVREAYEKAHEGSSPQGPAQALRWVASTISVNKGLPMWGYEALAQAREMRVEVLTAYAEVQWRGVREEYFV